MFGFFLVAGTGLSYLGGMAQNNEVFQAHLWSGGLALALPVPVSVLLMWLIHSIRPMRPQVLFPAVVVPAHFLMPMLMRPLEDVGIRLLGG